MNSTFAELVAQPGLYKRIWDIQNKLEDALNGQKHSNAENADVAERDKWN